MDKKISELDQALLLNNDADFPLSQDNAGEPTTFRAKLTQLATKIAEDMTFSNLQTTSKKLVGAINELLSLGSPIIIGTTAPTSSIGADDNLYIQYTAGTGGADDEVDGIFVKINGAWCEIQTGGGSGTTDYEDLSNKPQVNSVELVGNKSLDDLGIMPASLSKTVSGSIVHITDGGDDIPVKSLVSEIVAVESGNGQPKSPTNPYTISGFANGIITRCGKNLFDKNQTFTNGIINAQGEEVAHASYIYTDYIKVISGTYTTSGDVALDNTRNAIACYDANKNFIERLSPTSAGGWSFTLPQNTVYIRMNLGGSSRNLDTIQLEVGDTATTYEAYNGNTYTFAFGQTVYGGHFDNKGNLVVTHGIVDLGSLNYTTTTSRLFATLELSGVIKTPASTTIIGNINSSIYFPVTSSSITGPLGANPSPDGAMAVNPAGTLYFNNVSITTISDFKTAMNGILLVYELSTPITLSITSQDIPTLLGENNIFSNCGDVEVDYYTDKADEIVEVTRHHYSEDEQVVGTWIDGSTLYERSFLFEESSETQSKTYNIASYISNALMIVDEEIRLRLGVNANNLIVFGNFQAETYKCECHTSFRASTNTFQLDVNVPSVWKYDKVWYTIRYTKSST